jgi:hypothetical protein
MEENLEKETEVIEEVEDKKLSKKQVKKVCALEKSD